LSEAFRVTCQSKSRAPAGQKAELRLVKEQSAYVVYANALSRIDSLYCFYLKENILLFHKTT
jgi:hypothetical protein